MEITRQFRAALSVPNDPAPPVGATFSGAASAVSAIAPVGGVRSGLEAIQQALSALPHVDMDKVAAIRGALASGDIALDSLGLASSMLGYHRGKNE